MPAEDALPDGTGNAGARVKWSIARYREAQQNEFAARMDWFTTQRFDEANHAPTRNGGLDPVFVSAAAGDTTILFSDGWSDPDNDNLNYRWWFYEEPGTGTLGQAAIDSLAAANINAVLLDLTGVAAGSSLHVILEVTDDHASVPLTRYQRFIVQTTGVGVPEPAGLTGLLLLGAACGRLRHKG